MFHYLYLLILDRINKFSFMFHKLFDLIPFYHTQLILYGLSFIILKDYLLLKLFQKNFFYELEFKVYFQF